MDEPVPDGRTATANCVFGKALLAHGAACECAEREVRGELLRASCRSPVAHTNCATLAALLHERARFALRLPPAGQPLLHAQALRLQCGGLAALQGLPGVDATDVHRAVMGAQQRYGSLTELPWADLVAALAAWQPPGRRGAR